jgi:hypothetical protein
MFGVLRSVHKYVGTPAPMCTKTVPTATANTNRNPANAPRESEECFVCRGLMLFTAFKPRSNRKRLHALSRSTLRVIICLITQRRSFQGIQIRRRSLQRSIQLAKCCVGAWGENLLSTSRGLARHRQFAHGQATCLQNAKMFGLIHIDTLTEGGESRG